MRPLTAYSQDAAGAHRGPGHSMGCTPSLTGLCLHKMCTIFPGHRETLGGGLTHCLLTSEWRAVRDRWAGGQSLQMLIRTVGFLPGGEHVRLIIVIRQGMRGENLEGWECEQRLDLEHSPQGRDQRGQADRKGRWRAGERMSGQESQVKFTKQQILSIYYVLGTEEGYWWTRQMRSLFCSAYGGGVGVDNKQETNTRSFQRVMSWKDSETFWWDRVGGWMTRGTQQEEDGGWGWAKDSRKLEWKVQGRQEDNFRCLELFRSPIWYIVWILRNTNGRASPNNEFRFYSKYNEKPLRCFKQAGVSRSAVSDSLRPHDL